MNAKEKMMEIIKNKQSGGKSDQKTVAKNDGKFMRPRPVLHK
ncbi:MULTISPECIES: hypothetical protein [unclassified Jeotgalibaca]